MKELRKIIAETRLKSIALPALGCGAGGLKWEDVKPMIQQYLEDVEADVLVYERL